MKQIRVSLVVYEMLKELSRKNKVKPDLFVEALIHEKYLKE